MNKISSSLKDKDFQPISIVIFLGWLDLTCESITLILIQLLMLVDYGVNHFQNSHYCSESLHWDSDWELDTCEVHNVIVKTHTKSDQSVQAQPQPGYS